VDQLIHSTIDSNQILRVRLSTTARRRSPPWRTGQPPRPAELS